LYKHVSGWLGQGSRLTSEPMTLQGAKGLPTNLFIGGESYMNPVVGLDVSKGESQVQAFLDKGKPYRKSFSVMHTLDGLDLLLEFLVEVTRVTDGKKPSVILESTGHYHHPVIQFLEDHHYVYIVVNPLVSHRSRSANLRKVKTDAADAYQLCELFYKEELAPHRKRGIQFF
jgi:transposase